MAAGTAADSSGAAAFELYNFHDEHDLEAAAAFLGGPGVAGDGPSVLPAFGRRPRRGPQLLPRLPGLPAARERVAAARSCTSTWPASSPTGRTPWPPFFVHQAGLRRAAPSRELAEGLATRAFPPHEAAAILMALLLALDDPAATLAGLGDGAPAELLDSLLGELAAGPAAGGALRRLRPAERGAAGRAGRAGGTPAGSFRGLLVLRRNRRQGRAGGALRRVPRRDRAAFAGRAARARSPAAQAPIFPRGERSPCGRRPPASRRCSVRGSAELAADGQPESEIERGLAALFSAHPDLDKLLRSVLLFGILCGEAFPPKLLLELMGVSEEEADEVIDVIDAELVDQLGWIDDLEFRHPGFPGLQVYRIAHPQLVGTVLHRVGAETASAGASELLEALTHRLPPWTRVGRRPAPRARPPPGAGLPEAAPRAALRLDRAGPRSRPRRLKTRTSPSAPSPADGKGGGKT